MARSIAQGDLPPPSAQARCEAVTRLPVIPKVVSYLSADVLDDLLHSRVLACHLRGVVDPALAERVGERLLQLPGSDGYRNLPAAGLLKFGMALFEAHTRTAAGWGLDQQHLARYLIGARSFEGAIRGQCLGIANPLRLLVSPLAEHVPCERAMIDGQPAFAGLVRFTSSGIRPHSDNARKDHPDVPFTQSLRGQLAVNLYLKAPTTGGALTIWERGTEQGIPHAYGVQPTTTPPSLTIQPCPGDMIIFNSEHLHGVTAAEVGERVNISCFAGPTGDGSSWVYWS